MRNPMLQLRTLAGNQDRMHPQIIANWIADQIGKIATSKNPPACETFPVKIQAPTEELVHLWPTAW